MISTAHMEDRSPEPTSVLHTRGAVTKLLRGFPALREGNLFDTAQDWPELNGCLVILFTSRSGSTYLCRELEKTYRIGTVGESFNHSQLIARAKRKGLQSPAAALRYTVEHMSENRWFGFKTGNAALAIAEMSGFMEQYRDKIRFLLLLRRDLVAQAISQVKASLSSRYHSTQRATKIITEDDFSFEAIFRAIGNTLPRILTLAKYASLAGHSCERVYYEDFEAGDLSRVTSVCDGFGLPQRVHPPSDTRPSVQKIRDSVNAAWHDRFLAEADDRVQAMLQEYSEFLATA